MIWDEFNAGKYLWFSSASQNVHETNNFWAEGVNESETDVCFFFQLLKKHISRMSCPLIHLIACGKNKSNLSLSLFAGNRLNAKDADLYTGHYYFVIKKM